MKFARTNMGFKVIVSIAVTQVIGNKCRNPRRTDANTVLGVKILLNKKHLSLLRKYGAKKREKKDTTFIIYLYPTFTIDTKYEEIGALFVIMTIRNDTLLVS